MGILSTLKKMYEKMLNARSKLLLALSDKGIKIIEDNELLEEWGTIAILNSYYIRELNKLTIYEIMHIERKKSTLFDNSSTITIHNCVELAKKLKKNENRNIINHSLIAHSRIYWDNVIAISWSIIETGGGIAYDIYNNIIVSVNNGNSWQLLDSSNLPNNIKKIITIAFTKNIFFVIACTGDAITILLYEYSMGHWFISNTDIDDRLKVFHPAKLYNSYHIEAFIQSINSQFNLIIHGYGILDNDKTNYKMHTFILPINYNPDAPSSIKIWTVISSNYLSKIPNDSKIYFNKFKLESLHNIIGYHNSIIRYIISGTSMYLSIQSNIMSDLIITRKYDVSAFEYGEISKDIGKTESIHWIQTTLGYFFISGSMEITYVNNMKLFIPIDSNKGIALMSDKKLYIYTINTLSEINTRNMNFNYGFRGSAYREVFLHEEILGIMRIIFNSIGQIEFISFNNPSLVSPLYQSNSLLKKSLYATNNAGTIVAFSSPSIRYNINSSIKENIRNLICSYDNGITWNIIYSSESLENVYGIWYIDNKYVVLDQDGKIHYGTDVKNIMENAGASLEDSSGTLFKNRIEEFLKTEYYLSFELNIDGLDIIIVPVYHSISDLNESIVENPPFIYRDKMSNLFVENAIIPVINLYEPRALGSKSPNSIGYKSILENTINSKNSLVIKSSDSTLIANNRFEIIIKNHKIYENHSNVCNYIDHITGKQRHYSGRLYDICSKKEILSEYHIVEILNIETKIIFLLESNKDNSYFIGHIDGTNVNTENNQYISNIDIISLHYAGYNNFIITNNNLYHIYNNSLMSHSLTIIDENNEYYSQSIVSNVIDHSHIRHINGSLLIISSNQEKNISILNGNSLLNINNNTIIQDMCEWDNKIWFICNITIGEETSIFLGFNEYFFDIFKSNSNIISGFINFPNETNDLFQIKDFSIIENTVLTPCGDYMLIWNMNSNVVIKFQNFKFSKVNFDSNIKCVSYSEGVVYLMTSDNSIFYTYDSEEYIKYNNDNSEYIWNMLGTLCITTTNKNNMIINSDIIGENQGYIYYSPSQTDKSYMHPYSKNSVQNNMNKINTFIYK